MKAERGFTCHKTNFNMFSFYMRLADHYEWNSPPSLGCIFISRQLKKCELFEALYGNK